MALQIPTTEPTSLRAGDTWQWRREDLAADFPASSWTLTYYFRNATSKFDVAATADGDNFVVTVAKATTAVLPPGAWDWLAVADSTTQRFEADAGRLTIQPNLAASEPHDGRSFARRMLEAIESAMESRATSDQLDMVNATLADRGIQRDKGGLIALRSQFKAEVAREEHAGAIAKGLGGKNRLLVRFS
jgi:hypothetical protein